MVNTIVKKRKYPNGYKSLFTKKEFNSFLRLRVRYRGEKTEKYFNGFEVKRKDGKSTTFEKYGFYYDQNGQIHLFNIDEQEELLSFGKPCLLTDIRFKNAYLTFNNRYGNMKFKDVMRKLKSLNGIKSDLYIEVETGRYNTRTGEGINFNYMPNVNQTKNIFTDFQVTHPKFSRKFKYDDEGNKLIDLFRSKGFLVIVSDHEEYVDRNELVDGQYEYLGRKLTHHDPLESYNYFTIDTEVAICYGHGYIVGFGEKGFGVYGYGNSYNTVLFEQHDCHDKWSTNIAISRNQSDEEIVDYIMNFDRDKYYDELEKEWDKLKD